MTKNDFTIELIEKLEEKLKEEYGFDIEIIKASEPALKTNSVKEAYSVKLKDSNVAPSIYPEDFYDEFKSGRTIEEIANNVGKSLANALENAPIAPEITLEEAKRCITLVPINTEKNKVLLEKTPNYQIAGGEISVIPRWNLSNTPMGEASFVVSNSIAAHLGCTPDEVIQIGMNNIKQESFVIKPIMEILRESMGMDDDMFFNVMGEDSMPMLVCTNSTGIRGASVMLSDNAMAEVHERLGDFVILPSSVSEIICVPQSEAMEVEQMISMVREINSTEVRPEDFLSDNIFMVGEDLKIKLVTDDMKMEPIKQETMERTMRYAM